MKRSNCERCSPESFAGGVCVGFHLVSSSVSLFLTVAVAQGDVKEAFLFSASLLFFTIRSSQLLLLREKISQKWVSDADSLLFSHHFPYSVSWLPYCVGRQPYCVGEYPYRNHAYTLQNHLFPYSALSFILCFLPPKGFALDFARFSGL